VLAVLWTEWPVKRLRREAERDFFLLRLRSVRRWGGGSSRSGLLGRGRRVARESLARWGGARVRWRANNLNGEEMGVEGCGGWVSETYDLLPECRHLS